MLWWAVKTKNRGGSDEVHDQFHKVILDHDDLIQIEQTRQA